MEHSGSQIVANGISKDVVGCLFGTNIPRVLGQNDGELSLWYVRVLFVEILKSFPFIKTTGSDPYLEVEKAIGCRFRNEDVARSIKSPFRLVPHNRIKGDGELPHHQHHVLPQHIQVSLFTYLGLRGMLAIVDTDTDNISLVGHWSKKLQISVRKSCDIMLKNIIFHFLSEKFTLTFWTTTGELPSPFRNSGKDVYPSTVRPINFDTLSRFGGEAK